MSEQSSKNSTLFFLVGGLLVAVLVIGYFVMRPGGSGDPGANPPVAAAGTVEETGTKFKLDVDKDGEISGTIEGKSD